MLMRATRGGCATRTRKHRRHKRSRCDAISEITRNLRDGRPETPRSLCGHLGSTPYTRTPFHLEARANRRRVSDQARFDRQRRAFPQPNVSRIDLREQHVWKERKRRGVKRLPHWSAGDEQEDDHTSIAADACSVVLRTVAAGTT